jgi:hypothetical protein
MRIHKIDKTVLDIPLSQIDSIAFSFQDSIPAITPIAYYPFSGNPNDSSGNGHNGIVGGGATLASDRFGVCNRAYSFNAEGNYIDLGTSTALNPLNAMTIAVWVYPTVASGVYRNIVTRIGTVIQEGLDQRSYVIHVSPTEHMEFLTSRDGTAPSGLVTIIDPAPLQLFRWYFFVATWDGSMLRLYRDGNLVSSAFQSGMYPSPMLKTSIGSALGKGGSDPVYAPPVGIIDDVRFYNRALSVGEIQGLYHEGGW